MVVDSSAWVAVVLREPERLEFLRKLAKAPAINVSAVILMEASTVLLARGGQVPVDMLDGLLLRLRARIVTVDRTQAILARQAYGRYGRGFHKAALNLGDSFSYALAEHLGEPLLFKGNDFSQTDVLKA
jgi:ribonuclease VapC